MWYPTYALVLSLVALAGSPLSDDKKQGSQPLKGVRDWLADYSFKCREFTFVRIQYAEAGVRRRNRSWMTDYPAADLNLSAQLKQLTSLEVDEKGK